MSKQRGGEHQGGQHAHQDKASGAWRGLAAGNWQAARPVAIKAKITVAVQFILTWMLAWHARELAVVGCSLQLSP